MVSTFFVSSRLVFNCCLYLVTSSIRLTFIPSCPFTSAWYRREDKSVFGVSTPAQKIWDLCCCFFLWFSVTAVFPRFWLTYNECFWPSSQRSAGCPEKAVCFFFSLFSSLSLSPEIFFIPWTYQITLEHAGHSWNNSKGAFSYRFLQTEYTSVS